MKIWYGNFRTSNYVMRKFQVRIFWEFREIIRQRASWPGRADWGRPGSSRIWFLHQKIIIFSSMNHKAKINISRVMMLFLLSHMTVTGSSLRRSTLRFASRHSPPLANNIYEKSAYPNIKAFLVKQWLICHNS